MESLPDRNNSKQRGGAPGSKVPQKTGEYHADNNENNGCPIYRLSLREYGSVLSCQSSGISRLF